MPARQPWVDPNTGATYPVSWDVWRINQVDQSRGIIDITNFRYASITCYSGGFTPINTTATQISGQVYASFFLPTVSAAQASFILAVYGAAGSYISAAPEFSGATFF